jgi:protein CpxP
MTLHLNTRTGWLKRGFAAILAAGLLVAASAWILAGGRGPRPARGSEDSPRLEMMERALERLDLTEAQRAQVEPILAGLTAGLEDERDRRIEAQDALLQAVRKPSVDAPAVKAAAAKIAALERESFLARAKAWSEIYPILTERQAGGLDLLAAGPGKHARDAGRERMTDETRHALGRAFRGLDLTEEQEEQVRAAFENRAAAVRALRKEDVAAHDELRAAMIKPSFDPAAVEAAAAKHARAHEGLALTRAETHAAIWKVLTDEQRAQLEERQNRRPRGKR